MKPCLTCGRPSRHARCPEHTPRRAYDTPLYKAERHRTLIGATTCSICGGAPTPNDPLEADHIHPVSEGGNPAGPLRPAHRSCNRRRGALRQAGRVTN